MCDLDDRILAIYQLFILFSETTTHKQTSSVSLFLSLCAIVSFYDTLGNPVSISDRSFLPMTLFTWEFISTFVQ